MALVYLAGPISGCTYEGATDWREYARSKFPVGIIGLSPMRSKKYLAGELSIPKMLNQSVLSTQKGIMGRDMFDVRRADMLVVNLLGAKKVSVGTMIEVGAAYALNKPVVLVMEYARDIESIPNIHEHPMLQEACAWHVDTLDQGIAVVRSVLGWD